MAYSELIKNFDRIRDYMRDFYVYGFKSREEYSGKSTGKSARSYDDERRRIESWLGDYMRFRRTPEGKNVFLSIDSRDSRHNPLYAAWKAKSFTDGDITLHFLLFDILYSPEIRLSLKEISEAADARLAEFDEPRLFDVSTLRKKLNEYISEGIVQAEKRGRTLYYRRADARTADGPALPDVLDFFSETAPCGVIGSYLLDRQPPHEEHFAFKHHYITGALDSGIVCSLLQAMSEKRIVTLEMTGHTRETVRRERAVPLRLMISAQSGRQYLMAYIAREDRIDSFRADYILSVKPEEVTPRFDELREKLNGMLPHIWGISLRGASEGRTEHVEFTVTYAADEMHIPQRLEREKRCGTVEHIDGRTSRFSADVYDSGEMVPWIRTFLCRITDIRFSNRQLDEQFRKDVRAMYALYGLEGGDGE